jgi:hypothetical protein
MVYDQGICACESVEVKLIDERSSMS